MTPQQEKKLNEFIVKYLNQPIDWDKKYGRQCVDVYRQAVNDIYGFKQSQGVAGAEDIWATYNRDDFDAIPNTPTGIPPMGSFVIYKRSASNGFHGHVALVLFSDINNMVYFQQNGLNPKGVAHIVKAKYTNCLGWLVAKK